MGAAAGLRISLLALNGLRVSEAIGSDIEALVVESGHGALVITRKGGKVVTIPLAIVVICACRSTGIESLGSGCRGQEVALIDS